MPMHYEIRNRMKVAQINAEKLRNRLSKLVEEGLSQRQICNVLNSKGIKTSKGNDWYVSSLASALKRLDLKTKRRNNFYLITDQ